MSSSIPICSRSLHSGLPCRTADFGLEQSGCIANAEPRGLPDRIRHPMAQDRPNGFHATQVWIYIGVALFLVALLVSAMVVRELRVLHSFQALIYVVVIVLAHRNSPWGYGAGFAVATVWNAMSLFVTHLIQTGVVAFWSSLHTGHVEQLVPMIFARAEFVNVQR